MRPRAYLAMTLAGLGAAMLVAVVLAPLASTAPDGLEKVAADKGLTEENHDTPMSALVLMPDYAFFGLEGGWAKAAAGFTGTVVTFGIAYLLARLLRRREKTGDVVSGRSSLNHG